MRIVFASFSGAVVLNGVPGMVQAVSPTRRRGTPRAHRTELGFEDVRPIIWLDKHDLILVSEVQWLRGVRLNGEVKPALTALEQRIERGAIPALVLLRDELGATEAGLRWTAAGREDRRVVDGHAECLVRRRPPKRGRVDAFAEELDVL
jgi:hypothetical protein